MRITTGSPLIYFFSYIYSATFLFFLCDSTIQSSSFCIEGILPPAKEVFEGYVFTGVCLSTGGLCPGDISVREVSVQGVSVQKTPVRLRAGGAHPTAMHSCFLCDCTIYSSSLTLKVLFVVCSSSLFFFPSSGSRNWREAKKRKIFTTTFRNHLFQDLL